MTTAFRVLAQLKWLRGTPFDVFGYGTDRKRERALIRDYEALLSEIVATLSPRNLGIAAELASLPERIRGFGHVKERNIAAVAVDRDKLLQQYRQGGGVGLAA